MLEVHDLSCAYGNVNVVNELSFSAPKGSIFGLIGANGAGKTTTLMAIAGLNRPVGGQILVHGEDITALPAEERGKHGIALVPEGRRVFADLTVDENLTIGGTQLDSDLLEQTRDEVFSTFPRLKERSRQLAGSLSGGEQQMLAIGRAMMARPSILLVDELSLGLMPKIVDECYNVLLNLTANGLTIVLVEQNTERVLKTADHVAVLESGRLAWAGAGKDAINNQSIVEAYLGLS